MLDLNSLGACGQRCRKLGSRRSDAERILGLYGGGKSKGLLPERLVQGYEAFLSARFAQEQDRFRQLAAAGQAPRIMLIGCCDSRVPPEVIFDAGPGELF